MIPKIPEIKNPEKYADFDLPREKLEYALREALKKINYGIECFGPIRLGKGASVTAEGAGEDVDIFCYGALVNCGATVKGEVVAIGGEHSK